MNNTLKIEFSGPFGLLGNHNFILFDQPICKSYGIYIWTARMNQSFIIEYIGMTTKTFKTRNMEHILNTFSGYYRICDSKMIKEGKIKIIWPGIIRKKNGLSEFSDNYLKIAPFILKYLQTIEVFVATIKSERRIIERIEGALAYHVWNQPLPANALLPKDVHYRIRKENEMPINVMINCDEKILGIPKKIMV